MRAPFTDHVAALPSTVPFVGPETQERARGRPFRARLGANESVFGPAPEAVAAMVAAAAEGWKYGDPENHALKSALAADAGVPPACVAVGEGVDGLLGVALRLFVEAGTPIVTSLGAYPTFAYHAAGLDARVTRVPYRADREDLSALADAAAAEEARVVYLANPDNPMGTWRTGAEIMDFRAVLPKTAVLFLDEAYREFAPAEAHAPVAADDPGVIRFRTFSKARGMAGLRIGYALAAPEVAAAFDKLRNHFGVNRVAQAGALASLGAPDHLASVVARVAEARGRLATIAAENGLAAIPSAANFVAIDCGRDGVFARRVLEEMVARDVFIRMPVAAPLDRCIRVSAGTDADLALFAETLPDALAAAGAG